MQKEQTHLNHKDTINFGSFYTPDGVVSIVYNMLHKNVPNLNSYTIADTSCGYGNFLQIPGSIGADYDKVALTKAKNNISDCRFFHHNSLHNVSRSRYNIKPSDKLIIVGNPPYNDVTSIIRNGIKQEYCKLDEDLKHRDLGISFLLSYYKLCAYYICVLHPFSYLIKKANFEGLKQFKNNYALVDSVIISSHKFYATSKVTPFPIVIALYKLNSKGMTYDFICNYNFITKEGKQFKINRFDKLSNYITKYPNKSEENFVAHFWTMRDINALKRTKTFIEKEVYNSIRVTPDKLALYCYADVFKEYIPNIPYYFGNSDIMIDYKEFNKIQDIFLRKSLRKYKFLNHLLPSNDDEKINYDLVIKNYFKNLLGEHYVDKKID